MNDKKNTARRNLLKSVVAGGGVIAAGGILPERWSRPVVQAVTLPAHAQTSPVSESDPPDESDLLDGVYVFNVGVTNEFEFVIGDAGETPGSILDMFITPAHAVLADIESCKEVTRVVFRINGSNVDICLSSALSTATDSAAIDPDTGKIDDVTSVGGSNVSLKNMVASAKNKRVDFDLVNCGSFSAPLTGGKFSCKPTGNVNLTMTTRLTSPFRA